MATAGAPQGTAGRWRVADPRARPAWHGPCSTTHPRAAVATLVKPLPTVLLLVFALAACRGEDPDNAPPIGRADGPRPAAPPVAVAVETVPSALPRPAQAAGSFRRDDEP